MAFENNISSINVNIDVTSSSNTKPTQATSITIPLGKKNVLTEEQKQDMLLLGLDPNNETQVTQYLSMKPEDIAKLRQAQMSEIPSNPEETSTHAHSTLSEPHSHEEHNHDFEIDTTSEQWKSMSNEEKLDAILTAGAKRAYTNEEWEALSVKEKQIAKDKFLNEELSLHYPGWKDAKTPGEQLQLLGEFIDENKIAKEMGIPLNQLIAMKTNNPEEYNRITTQFYDKNPKTDLLATIRTQHETQRKIQKDAYTSALEDYCSSNGLDINEFKKSSVLAEFNKNYAKQHGIKLLPDDAKKAQYYTQLKTAKIPSDDVEKRYEFIEHYIQEYGEEFLPSDIKQNKLAIEQLVAANGGSYDGLNDGDISIKDFLGTEGFVTKKNNRNFIDYKDFRNIHKADSILREKLNLSPDATVEEIQKAIIDSDLNAEAKVKAFEIFISKHNMNQSLVDSAGAIERPTAALLLVAVSRGGSGEHNEQVATEVARHQYEAIKANGGDTETFNQTIIKNMGRNFEQNTAAGVQLLGAELGDTNMIDAANQGVAERDDALEVFTIANRLYNESETISDEMKQFYAQNSIEHLQTPEQRAAQAEDLRSYNNDSFNTGVETGLTNAARGETSVVQDSNNQTNLQQSSDVSITLSEPAQQVYNSIEEMFQGQLHPEELKARFAELDPQEQTKLLKKYVESKAGKANVQLCNTFPELVPLFVNSGRGLEIVSRCSMPVGNLAIRLLPDKDKKRLAIENPHRLAQGTYQALVENGVVKVSESKNSYAAKA